MSEQLRSTKTGRNVRFAQTRATVDCLRVSVTHRCNLRCCYCRPSAGESPGPSERLRPVMTFEEIAAVVRLIGECYDLRTVRLTGGEPLLRPNIVRLAGMLAALGVDDLAMTTNAQYLPELAQPLRRAGLKRVNISLDSLNPKCFERLTRGGCLDRTLEGIEAARVAGFSSVKINTVVLRGINDSEVCNLVRFAIDRGIEIRFLELMAIGVSIDSHEARFVSSDEVIERLGAEFHLQPLDTCSTERTRMTTAEDGRGGKTRVGFISPESRPFCRGCRRLRLTSDGRLMACLMHNSGPDLMPALRKAGVPNLHELERLIADALAAKPAIRRNSSSQLMAGIGG